MELTAEIALEIAKLREGVNRSMAEMKRIKTAARNEGSGISDALFGGLKTAAVAAGAAITAALVGAGAGLKNAFDLGGELTDAASRMGTTAGKAQLLRAAFENAGLGAEDATTVINRMQKALVSALGGGQEAGIFKALNLDLQELQNMDPADAMQSVGKAIASIDDPAKRAAASMAIFGKSGGKLLSVFTDGGAIDFAAEQLGKQTEILDQSAADFDMISDTLGGAFHKLQGFFVGMGSRLVTTLKPAFEWFNKVDLAGIGQRFGDAIADAIHLIQAAWETLDFATIASLLGDALSIAVKGGVNLLWAGFNGVVAAFVQDLIEGVRLTVSAFAVLTTADFWKGMGNALLGIANAFAAAVTGVIATVLETVKSLPGGGSIIGDSDQIMRETSRQLGRDSAGNFADAGARWEAPFNSLAKQWFESMQRIGDAFNQGFNDAGNVFDNSESIGRLREAMGKLQQRADQIAKDAGESKAGPKFQAESTGDSSGQSKVRTPGLFQSAVNVLFGRSAMELVHEESKKQTALLEDIKRNTSRVPNITNNINGVATFA